MPGFGPLRIYLSFIVLFWHGFTVCDGLVDGIGSSAFQNQIINPLGRMVLPMFFGLSGFLVAGSAVRLGSLRVFLTFRILRLLPALLVEVTLSVLMLGMLFTSKSLGTYFSDPLTYRYFGNMVGQLSFFLPGVFRHHPIPMVNLNLWTLVPEFYCYIIITIIFALGLFNKRKWLLLGLLQAFVIFYLIQDQEAWVFVPVNNPWLIVCCMMGCLAFVFAEYIPIHPVLFWVSAALAYGFFYSTATVLPALLCTVYCAIYLGMVKLPLVPLLERGDYSYGVYLYGFPITQAVWEWFPSFRHGLLIFGLSAPVTLLFAALSWHHVEKPALTLKRYFLPKKAP